MKLVWNLVLKKYHINESVDLHIFCRDNEDFKIWEWIFVGQFSAVSFGEETLYPKSLVHLPCSFNVLSWSEAVDGVSMVPKALRYYFQSFKDILRRALRAMKKEKQLATFAFMVFC